MTLWGMPVRRDHRVVVMVTAPDVSHRLLRRLFWFSSFVTQRRFFRRVASGAVDTIELQTLRVAAGFGPGEDDRAVLEPFLAHHDPWCAVETLARTLRVVATRPRVVMKFRELRVHAAKDDPALVRCDPTLDTFRRPKMKTPRRDHPVGTDGRLFEPYEGADASEIHGPV